MLSDFTVQEIPQSAIYIPNFINLQEEDEILKRVYSVPKPKWTQLSNRRLQNWGGVPHVKGMIPEIIPDWLQKYINRIVLLNVFQEKNLPNHVLINEYLPGQGIMPHTDGPLFFPIVSTISCGSPTVLSFQPYNSETSKNEQHKFSLLLERRSLLILKSELYEGYMHGIDEVKNIKITKDMKNLKQCADSYEVGQTFEKTTRISLTIRNVPKCCKAKLFF